MYTLWRYLYQYGLWLKAYLKIRSRKIVWAQQNDVCKNLKGPSLLNVEHNDRADNRNPTNSNWQLGYGRAHLEVGKSKLYFELTNNIDVVKRELHQIVGACSPLLAKKLNGRHFEVCPLGFTSHPSHSSHSLQYFFFQPQLTIGGLISEKVWISYVHQRCVCVWKSFICTGSQLQC